MWIYVVNNENQSYYFKNYIRNDLYYFYVSDFINVWELILTKTDLSSLILENNPLIEAENSSLTKYCIDMLCESLSQKSHISSIGKCSPNENNICLNIKVLRGKFPFKISFKLKECSPLKFFEEVTSPLIRSVKELSESENHLVQTLLKKDIEIQEYKSEGAKITLKHLETESFNEIEHKNIHTPSRDSFISIKDASSILILNENKDLNVSIKKEVEDKSKESPEVKDNSESVSDIKPNRANLKREPASHIVGFLPFGKTEKMEPSDTVNRNPPPPEIKKQKKLLNFN